MLISILLAVAVLAFLAIGIVWSIFFRRLHKTQVRFIGIAASLVLAIILTVVLKSTVFNADTILPWIGAKMDPAFMDLLRESPSLCDVVLGAVSGLITPLLFFVLFLVLNFISWVVYLLITLVRGAKMKEKDATAPFAKQRTIAMAVVQTLIIAVVWLVPVAAYSGIAPVVMDSILEADVLPEETEGAVQSVREDVVGPINDNIVVNTFRVLGGNAITNSMTDFKVNGRPVHMKQELGTLTDLTCNVICLVQNDFASYSSKEEEAILAIADSFGESEILPVIGAEIVHGATTEWKSGGTFVGLDSSFMYIDSSGTLDEFIGLLIEILNDDSEKGHEDALSADLHTTAEILTVMIRGGVFESLGEKDAMMGSLSKDGVVNNVVTSLGRNDSMKILIPEITNIGVRSIADTLEVQEDASKSYDAMMNSIATGLNSAKNKTGDLQIHAVSDALEASFDNAGMAIEDDVLDAYSVAMIESIVVPCGERKITGNDVKAFFMVYAWSIEVSRVTASLKVPTIAIAGEVRRDWKDNLIGTVYANMSEDQLRTSGPAVLARISEKLAAASVTEDEGAQLEIRNAAGEMFRAEYASRLNDAGIRVFNHMTEKVNVQTASNSATASLGSLSTMKKYTQLVTLDKLLLDVYAAAKHIDSSNVSQEAAAIESVFNAAQELLEKSAEDSELDLDTITASIGLILDEMGNTAFFGRQRSELLFTAVLQSGMVREKLEIDFMTATKLAHTGSSGETLNYRQTFVTISKTVSMMSTANENHGDLTDGQVEELIRDINPQSAGMMEIYITPERMENSYNVPEKHAGTAAPLMSNMFHHLADAEMSDEQYQKEATATNNILSLTMAARDNASDPEHNQTLFGEEGVLGKEARPALDDLMASESLAASLRETPCDHDPFELSGMMQQDEVKDEKAEMEDAMRDYYAENPDEETYETLGLMANLFGLEDISVILGVGNN